MRLAIVNVIWNMDTGAVVVQASNNLGLEETALLLSDAAGNAAADARAALVSGAVRPVSDDLIIVPPAEDFPIPRGEG